MPALDYKNFRIELNETTGDFTVEGNTFKTLKECHNWVDKEKRKKYERVKALDCEYRWGKFSITEVVITSPSDNQRFGGQNVWISKDGRREKTQLSGLISADCIERVREISKRIEELEAERSALNTELRNMPRPPLPKLIENEK